MVDAEGTFVNCESFLEHLHQLPWCKQAVSKENEEILVAVHHCTPEVIDAIKDSEIKVFPGGMHIKLNKSTLHMLSTKFDEGTPLPMLAVWRKRGVEIWFRQHKGTEFPYDAWSNPAAATYESECAIIPADHFGAKFDEYFTHHISSAKACPSMIPPL